MRCARQPCCLTFQPQLYPSPGTTVAWPLLQLERLNFDAPSRNTNPPRLEPFSCIMTIRSSMVQPGDKQHISRTCRVISSSEYWNVLSQVLKTQHPEHSCCPDYLDGDSPCHIHPTALASPKQSSTLACDAHTSALPPNLLLRQLYQAGPARDNTGGNLGACALPRAWVAWRKS